MESIKKPAEAGFWGIKSLTDFRRIAEGDCEEEGGNREGKDEDVSEAFHRETPERRSVEGCSGGRHVTLGQTAGRFVAKFGEQTEFHLVAEIGVDTGGSNVQFAVCPNTGRIIIIEMNPRVSRSSALASKATGFPIAKVAAKLAMFLSLK